jgi:hypothetical protein
MSHYVTLCHMENAPSEIDLDDVRSNHRVVVITSDVLCAPKPSRSTPDGSVRFRVASLAPENFSLTPRSSISLTKSVLYIFVSVRQLVLFSSVAQSVSFSLFECSVQTPFRARQPDF